VRRVWKRLKEGRVGLGGCNGEGDGGVGVGFGVAGLGVFRCAGDECNFRDEKFVSMIRFPVEEIGVEREKDLKDRIWVALAGARSILLLDMMELDLGNQVPAKSDKKGRIVETV
jgi:hypothetical protein